MRLALVCVWIASLALIACGPQNPRVDAIAHIAGSHERGQSLFARHCQECHRKGGLMRMVGWYPKGAFLTIILDGSADGQMPSFQALSDQEISDLYAYIESANR